MKILKTIGLILLLPILVLGGALLNNTFNDDKIETVKTTIIDLEKEQKNLITIQKVQGGYLDPQQGSTDLYSYTENDAELTFLNINKNLVLAFNSTADFAEDFHVNTDGKEMSIYLFSTNEISYVELSTDVTCYYVSNGNSLSHVDEIYGKDGNRLSDLEDVMPKGCWSTMIDEDCSSREMKKFVDDLFVYSFDLNTLAGISIDETIENPTNLLEELKIYYR